jgi:signal transduction histidine kinase
MSALAASSVRGQHRYWLAVRQRTLDAVATRESLVRRSVAEERVRIARDLHDSVGHHIAVLSMHLGAAEVSLPPGSDVPLGHLRNARGSVQDVLAEVQQILAVLRLETGADVLAPTPELSHVPELVASFRNAGLDLEERLTGCDAPLPHNVSAAAYRIAQEALTNAQKHGTHGVRFTVHADEETVRIDVVNTVEKTSRTSGGSGGRGLVGVGERAESVGGRIEFHDRDGQFSFRAELPVDGGRA